MSTSSAKTLNGTRLRILRHVALWLLGLYIASYAVAYGTRGPAANMAYFVYFSRAVDYDSPKIEKSLYRFYYPIYKLHLLFGAHRHSYDRPEIREPKNFTG